MRRSTLPLDVTPDGFIFRNLAGHRATRTAVHLGILNSIRRYFNLFFKTMQTVNLLLVTTVTAGKRRLTGASVQ
jgi:hypothetical protein